MADYSVRPVNVFSDFLAGREAAHTERAMRNRNALAEIDIGREQGVNALMQNPEATPEQYARVGRSDIANSITNQRQFDQNSKVQAVQQLGNIAQKALTLDPVSRKAFLQQAGRIYGSAFQALGADAAAGMAELQNIPDAELEQRLQQVAAFGPALKEKEGFTLSPGSQRFDANGKMIASVAPTPEKAPSRVRALTEAELKAYNLPPGTSAQIDDTTGKVDVISKRDNTGVLSQKDSTTAKLKLNTVALARQQLAKIRESFNEGTKGINAFGPGQGLMPTQAGRKFDARVNQMRSTLTALTRVPGVGAMSDYETKLDQSKFPNRNEYESVTLDTLNNLDDQLALIETGYKGLLSGTDTTGQAPAPPPSAGPEITATGPNGEKIVLRNGQWVRQ